MRRILTAILFAAVSQTALASVSLVVDVTTRNARPVYSIFGVERRWEKQLEIIKLALASDPLDPVYLRPDAETTMDTIYAVIRDLERIGVRTVKLPAGEETIEMPEIVDGKTAFVGDLWLDVVLRK